MAIRWDMRDVVNFEELQMPIPGDPDHYQLPEFVKVVIFAMSLSIGFHQITKDNWKGVFARMKIYEGRFGPFWLNNEGKPLYLRPNDIYRLIGLKVNGNANTVARMAKDWHDDALKEAIRWEEEGKHLERVHWTPNRGDSEVPAGDEHPVDSGGAVVQTFTEWSVEDRERAEHRSDL